MAAMSDEKQPKEVALPLANNHILRMSEDANGNLTPLQLGHLSPLKEGQPIDGDVVCLNRRGTSPLYDFQTLVKNPMAPKQSSAGPPQVATPAYRSNYDRIFGKQADSATVH